MTTDRVEDQNWEITAFDRGADAARLDDRRWVIGVDRGTDEETVIVPQLIDGMQRQIHVGDVISWRSGGYFSHFLCFGFVISVNREQGNIKAVNQNGNKVTIWRTYLTNILARDGDYSLIPNEYMNKFGM